MTEEQRIQAPVTARLTDGKSHGDMRQSKAKKFSGIHRGCSERPLEPLGLLVKISGWGLGFISKSGVGWRKGQWTAGQPGQPRHLPKRRRV
ncbi:MAG: hypothetical protein CL912_27595 [Deltaproteobacteria bacterium]|nr:hypothetical protein [Deltaproteobacteria bacterium]